LTAKTTARSRPLRVRLTSAFGWLLLSCGLSVLLYLAYALLFTNVAAEDAQAGLRDEWVQRVPAAAPLASEAPSAAATEPAADPTVPPGEGVAMVEFARPGSATAPVHDGPLIVLDDVTTDDLMRGPGHYPGTAMPGQPGNFAVAGHRTTYGAPFFHLDALRTGDLVHVTDRRGRRFTYEVAGQRVVAPTNTSVIDSDPLGTGRPTLTLTTCNPRFSAAERLIVHAELVT
jgi:sortase A